MLTEVGSELARFRPQIPVSQRHRSVVSHRVHDDLCNDWLEGVYSDTGNCVFEGLRRPFQSPSKLPNMQSALTERFSQRLFGGWEACSR